MAIAHPALAPPLITSRPTPDGGRILGSEIPPAPYEASLGGETLWRCRLQRLMRTHGDARRRLHPRDARQAAHLGHRPSASSSRTAVRLAVADRSDRGEHDHADYRAQEPSHARRHAECRVARLPTASIARGPLSQCATTTTRDRRLPPLGRVVCAVIPASVFAGRVFHERKDAAGHESGAAHGFAIARHLGDLDDAASRGDFDAATCARGDDLVRPRSAVSSDDDLNAIALHAPSVPRPSRAARSGPA